MSRIVGAGGGIVLASAPGEIGGGTPAKVNATVTGISSETVTAHTGGTQAAGLQLSATKGVHVVSVCATAADSVLLPTVVTDEVHRVINKGAAALQVFGNGTSTINGVATATGVSIPVGMFADFHGGTAGAAGTWRASVPVAAGAAFDPAVPGAIGGGTPAVGTFTSLYATDVEFQTLASLNQIYPEWAGGITAHAGGTQAAAVALDNGVIVHRISVCATNGDSVRLPSTTYKGRMLLVHNRGAADLQVYGAGTETINGVATATGVTIPAGKSAWFTANDATDWDMLLGA